MKLAFITPKWGDKNGVASYAQNLVPLIAFNYLEHRIFQAPVSIAEVKEYQPDLVYIEYQKGLYKEDIFKALRGTPCFIKMHSVHACSYSELHGVLIAHSETAAKVLREHNKLRVEVIAHGCPPYTPSICQRPSTPCIFSFGFGLQYKGLETAIAIVKNLRQEFPDLVYYGCFNNPYPIHEFYMRSIKALIKKENLEKEFTIINEYKPIEIIQTFAYLSRVALFPYRESVPVREVYGTSGAARQALAWGIPVVTSCAPLFEDLKGVVRQGKNVEELTAHVRDALLDTSPAHIQAQKDFVTSHNWGMVAAEHVRLFESIYEP